MNYAHHATHKSPRGFRNIVDLSFKWECSIFISKDQTFIPKSRTLITDSSKVESQSFRKLQICPQRMRVNYSGVKWERFEKFAKNTHSSPRTWALITSSRSVPPKKVSAGITTHFPRVVKPREGGRAPAKAQQTAHFTHKLESLQTQIITEALVLGASRETCPRGLTHSLLPNEQDYSSLTPQNIISGINDVVAPPPLGVYVCGGTVCVSVLCTGVIGNVCL